MRETAEKQYQCAQQQRAEFFEIQQQQQEQ
jgi:hypothetical protein